MTTDTRRLPPITLLTILVEFFVIIVFCLNATSQFLNADSSLKIGGYEGEFLTNSATFAADSLHQYGYIPLWQPYLATGEPLIDNPFSFVLNPISILPSLAYGSNVGILDSIVLTAILAGLGGWALGRMLGFGSLGRVLLGLLLAGKGNMIAMIGIGEFQLGGSQAYMPWVMAGVVGVLRMKHQRLPVVLTALMITLMFWAGNIYYVLPTLMSVAGLAITHIIGVSRREGALKFTLDRAALWRLALTGLLTVGLSAVTFIPIFLHQSLVGAHPNEVGAGTYADLPTVFTMFFSNSNSPYLLNLVPGGPEFYDSFIVPFWFALVAFIVLPLITIRLARPAKSDAWKVVSVALVMIVFCLLWGTGQNPIIGWLYANVPLFAQWRFVGRVLGMASFWIAVLAAMQVDAFWRALLTLRSWKRVALFERLPGLQAGLLILTAAASLVAGSQVLDHWKDYGPGQYAIYIEDTCVLWLRQQYPDQYLSVWTQGYSEMTIYIDNDIRHFNFGGDYFPLGSPSTIFNGDLTRLLPEFGIANIQSERDALTDKGYQPLTNSPLTDPGVHCAYQKPDALPYAFTVSLPTLNSLSQTVPVGATTPITRIAQYPDQIGMLVDSSLVLPLVVTVQQVAYPGWTVQVDNQPAKLESVGGLLGVVIPPGTGTHLVYFAYRPPLLYFGGLLTVISAVLCILYLLRLDRFIPRRWIEGVSGVSRRAGKAAVWVLTSPELFEPRHPPAPDIPLLSPPEPPAPNDQAGEAPEASEDDEPEAE